MSNAVGTLYQLFAILQKYEFSSKSQPLSELIKTKASCLRYCKSTSFQANHNCAHSVTYQPRVVCDTAKVRVFKQITTISLELYQNSSLFAILQKYEFSSKSQLGATISYGTECCLRYCKSTSFQANHNCRCFGVTPTFVVCDTAKVRVFKQITTTRPRYSKWNKLFAILQKYEFSSKSQRDFRFN